MTTEEILLGLIFLQGGMQVLVLIAVVLALVKNSRKPVPAQPAAAGKSKGPIEKIKNKVTGQENEEEEAPSPEKERSEAGEIEG